MSRFKTSCFASFVRQRTCSQDNVFDYVIYSLCSSRFALTQERYPFKLFVAFISAFFVFAEHIPLRGITNAQSKTVQQ